MKSSVHVYIHKIYRYYVLHANMYTPQLTYYSYYTPSTTLNTTRLVNKHNIYLYLNIICLK